MIIDDHVTDLMTLSIEGAGILGLIITNGSPVVACQVNIFGQYSIDIQGTAVDSLCKPGQFRAGGYLINAVDLCRLCDGFAVPGTLSGLFDDKGHGKDTFHHIRCIDRTQVNGAVLTDVTLLGNLVAIIAVAKILVNAVFIGSQLGAIGAG